MARTIIEILLDVRFPLWVIAFLLFLQIPNKNKTWRRWRGNVWRNIFVKPYKFIARLVRGGADNAS